MKNRTLFAIIFVVLASFASKSQTFLVDTAKLNSSFRELVDKPNTIERQKAFFDAFPNTWIEFVTTYQYVSKKDYDLTMYRLAQKQVEALGGRVTLINDSLYCRKIVNVAIGGLLDADAPNYYKNLLHKVMWNKMDVMLYTISQLRKGHQMQFWQFYWSSNVKSKPLETEFFRLSKLNIDSYPEEMKIMKIAYDYFYDGVNIDGGYLKE
ncbi:MULTISPECIES: hypothetical protein [unclassified Proteiniphilum]|jgi:hypothetical protein|uniref:hypothetical protein n=1 Tax=unclassified Proteiniphilum TaxID=2622718 RepID=UPI00257A909A|nr:MULTISPECIES: hypothetical protein [unclassified Proteiniphilum]